MEARVGGKGGKGRPTRWWEQDIGDWFGTTTAEAGRLARDGCFSAGTLKKQRSSNGYATYDNELMPAPQHKPRNAKWTIIDTRYCLISWSSLPQASGILKHGEWKVYLIEQRKGFTKDCVTECYRVPFQSINQSNFYIANIPGKAKLSGATVESVFNNKIDEAVPWHQRVNGCAGVYGGKVKSKKCVLRCFLKVGNEMAERTDSGHCYKEGGTRVKCSCTCVGLDPREGFPCQNSVTSR